MRNSTYMFVRVHGFFGTHKDQDHVWRSGQCPGNVTLQTKITFFPLK